MWFRECLYLEATLYWKVTLGVRILSAVRNQEASPVGGYLCISTIVISISNTAFVRYREVVRFSESPLWKVPAHGQKCTNKRCTSFLCQTCTVHELSTILPHPSLLSSLWQADVTLLHIKLIQSLNHYGHTYMHIHTTYLHTYKHNLRLGSHASSTQPPKLPAWLRASRVFSHGFGNIYIPNSSEISRD